MHTSAFVRRAAGGLGLGVLAAGLVGLPGTAQAAPATHLVINEVYGGGGNSGALWTHDFVELDNPTAQPISLAGLSLQYRSSSGTGTGFHDLSGTVAAGSSFLLQESQGSGGTKALPTPDGTGALTMRLGLGHRRAQGRHGRPWHHQHHVGGAQGRR